MAFKPFKPLSIKTSPQFKKAVFRDYPEPPPKRRKLSEESTERRPGGTPAIIDISDSSPPLKNINRDSREPLKPIRNVSIPEERLESEEEEEKEQPQYFTTLWRRITTKKNKTWDDDGFLIFAGGQITLVDKKGKQIGCSSRQSSPKTGELISVSGREVQVEDSISKRDFDKAVNPMKNPADRGSHEKGKPAQSLPLHSSLPKTAAKLSLRDQLKAQMDKGKNSEESSSSKSTAITAGSIQSAFRQPFKDSTVLQQFPSEIPIPRHDPKAPGALVFKRPLEPPSGKQIVDVVLDPLLGKRLREHQRHGIEFLYECVMGLRNTGGQGCILADDMGLGKTLQTIALLWTLMKQNPVHKAEPVVKKALIVCPVTLVDNWKKEFRKWLGQDRLGVMTFGDKTRLRNFDGRNFKVMIVGYERLRSIAEDLARGPGIDIIICDEGHRLKTLQNKSTQAMDTLNTAKKVILSGTPIQNDLSEFFAMVNFVNDGVLGTYKAFVKDFEKPIMKSRQPDASEDDIEKGQDASSELTRTTSPFILRRTAEILSAYLPPKSEYVLFCQPTREQASIYRQVLKTPMFQSALGGSEAALQLITILKKLCNSPALLRPNQGSDESITPSSLQTLNEMLPPAIPRFYQNSYAAKIRLLDELLQQIRNTTDDKVVLVSNYTATLNLMANLLSNSALSYRRLDGSVPNAKRQGLVDEFNRASQNTCFAFLLSAKAGGVGLNLVGGNRLILFDVDWNPATDDQAMARIHREGQKKPCKIYRFLIKGGLEERIWQRQVVKRGLAESIMEGGGVESLATSSKKGKAAFSREELRDLFRLDEASGLRTHDLIGCPCGGSGKTNSTCTSRVVSGAASPVPPTGAHSAPAQMPIVHDVDDSDDAVIPRRKSKARTSAVAKIVKASDLVKESAVDLTTDTEIDGQASTESPDSQPGEEMQELMKYSHIDTSSLPGFDIVEDADAQRLDAFEEKIDDPCLMHVLRQRKDIIAGNIAYVFKKTSKADAVAVQIKVDPV